MISKEEFEWAWKDSSVYDILNQFYWEHCELRKRDMAIEKAIEKAKSTPCNCPGVAEDLVADMVDILEKGE